MFAGSAVPFLVAISVLLCSVHPSHEDGGLDGFHKMDAIFDTDTTRTDFSDQMALEKQIGSTENAFYEEIDHLKQSGKLDAILADLERNVAEKEEAYAGQDRKRRAVVESNRPPAFTAPMIITANVGDIASENITAEDPDGDDLVFSMTRKSSIASITTDGRFATAPLIMAELGMNFAELLGALFDIEFQVDDGNGGKTTFMPEWHICSCGNGGLCDHDTLKHEGRIHISGCICLEGFTGPSCEDEDACFGGNKCFKGVLCYDNPYPLIGFRCGPCPRGYRGDGIVCESEGECTRPLIANGRVLAKDFAIGSRIAFECNGGYELIGVETVVCGEDGAYRQPIPTCEDVDECIRPPCHADANCVNTDGSFLCNCKPDFVGDGRSSCVPLIGFEHFSCESLGNDSIRVNWQVTDAWRGSSSITQFIVSWYRAEEFDEDAELSFKLYNDNFASYEELLDDADQQETISSLRYQAVNRDQSSFVISGLKPNTRYRVGTRIQVDFDVVSVNPVRICHRITGEGVSSPPLELQVEEVQSSSFVLSWNAPEHAQGDIRGFVIEYKQASSCEGTDACENPRTVQVTADSYREEIVGLRPSTAYLIRVAAVNGAGVGMYSGEIKAITKQGSEIPITPTEEASRDGVCFDGMFTLKDEWKSNSLQQSLLIKNLESTLTTLFSEAELSSFTILDLSLKEVADVTRVKFHLYLKNISVPNELEYSQWYENIEVALKSKSDVEKILKTMDHTSVSVNECNECHSPKLHVCGEGTRCINLLGGYTCQCKAGYAIAKKSSVLTELPITCKWKRGPRPTPKKPTLAPVYQACSHARYDIVFLVDSSRSVTDPSFRGVRQAIKEFIQGFNIGTYDTQVAVATYSEDIQVAFYLKTNQDKQQLLQAVDNIPYSGFGTKSGNGIQKLLDEIVTSSQGRRSLSQLHVVFITDGQSSDSVEGPARNLHAVTKHVYAIGVSDRTNRTELRTIAGKDGRVVQYRSYKTLEDEMAATLQGLICPSYTCRTHDDYMDVVFALESTSNIDSELFSKMKDFVSDVVEDLDIRRIATQVAVVTMASNGLDEFLLGQYRTKERVLRAVGGISGPGVDRELNIGKAVEYLEYNMLSPNRGRRMDAGLVIVMLTSAHSNDDFDEAVTRLRKNHGAAIHTIGIAFPKRSNLERISRPNGTVFMASTRRLNLQLKDNVLNEMRKSASCPKRRRCKHIPKRLRKIGRGKRKFC